MDTNKPSSDIDDIPSCRRDDIIPFVLLHQARRDQAVLGRPGTRALNLYAYYRKRQGEVVTQLAQAAFLRSLVTEVQAEIHRLIDGAGPLVLEGGGDHVPALAAAWTARTMLWYPVQRQRLPSSPSRISSSVGFGFSFRSETVAMTNPGVQ